MKKILILLIVATLFFTACDKKENKVPLTGAFGVKFGEIIQITDNTVNILRHDKKMYKINPPKKMDIFDSYYVGLTPITHKVYSIYATKKNKSDGECNDNFRLIEDLLTKKYGRTRRTESPSTLAYTTGLNGMLSANEGFAMYSCYIFDLPLIYNRPSIIETKIYYRSHALESQYDKETKSLIKNKDAL